MTDTTIVDVNSNTHENLPDNNGHFGQYGGRFVAETLMGPLQELADAYEELKSNPSFIKEFDEDLAHYVGRPSPLYYAERLTNEVGGAKIYLKREDLNHTGAHKINNTCLLYTSPSPRDQRGSRMPSSA